MDSINVDCRSRNYDVVVGNGLDDLLFEMVGDKKVLVVTDSEVYSEYRERIEIALPQAEVFVVRPGERSKTENVLFDLIEFMLQKEFDRRSILIAFGGGVVGDLTGFAASIYMRGIDYIQIPTTLLAQVDSAIGGKTGINVDGVKNAIGTFYQPKSVIVDVDFLRTLEEKDITSGLGEIVKTGCLDENLFNFLEENIESLKAREKMIIMEAVEQCVQIKADIVEDDERETKSIRNKLNVGHTIGHALEISARFMPKTHGEYVLYGLFFEAEISKQLDRIEPSYKERLQNLIVKVLGEVPEISSVEKIVRNAMKDKKNRDGMISVILPIDVGDVDEVLLTEEQMIELLSPFEE